MPTSSHTAALATATATALLLPAVTAAPARADEKPPAKMSSVGGAQLGHPGTQMKPKQGAGKPPKLPKGITSRSWIVSDAESGEVLAAHNAHWKLAPASTLKMLFADALLPKFDKTQIHKVTPSDLAGMGLGSSMVGVKEGESYTVRDLWRGVFLRSGNDAVRVLAAMNGGIKETVRQMQAHARKLNADDTHVISPDGYDAKGQVSSAYDLTLIARSGLQKADFREYAATARAKFPGETRKGKKGKRREYFEIQNTNRLLTGDFGLNPYPGIAGVKNGETTHAGSTFTGVAQRGDRVLLVTVMHPKQGDLQRVYKETAKLFDWGFQAAGKVKPVGALVPPGEPRGAGHNPASGGDKGAANADQAVKAQKQRPTGGVGTALGVTGVCLVLLAMVGYAVHRRWPLPDHLNRLRRRPEGEI